MHSVLVTGSNRGLGLEWARQYAEAGWRVYATCRRLDEAEALQPLADAHPEVSIHRLDVADREQVEDMAAVLAGQPLDLLINNPVIYTRPRQDGGPAPAARFPAHARGSDVRIPVKDVEPIQSGPMELHDSACVALRTVRDAASGLYRLSARWPTRERQAMGTGNQSTKEN